MSQQLTPINGGVEQVVSNTSITTANVLSPSYIVAKNLQSRPTEWVPGGRPIYRRLPAISETYQIDFFNIVDAPNTAAAAKVQDIGYIYVPWTENSAGPTSVAVSASEGNRDLLICGGRVIWKNGGTQVYPTILNLEDLNVGAGRYYLAYELSYDDAPVEKIYSVTDFSLVGQPLTITSSTDNIVGWRYPAVSAFLNQFENFWTSKDTYFPTYAQPTSSYLQWESTLGQAYSNVTLRCPPGTGYVATASIYYVTPGGNQFIQGTVAPSVDSTGQYYEFNFSAPVFNTGWKVVWSDTDVAIQSITISGSVVQMKRPAAPSTLASLSLYKGIVTPPNAIFCPLAYVEVDNKFKVTSIEDIRYVVRRDYVPVANWLTRFFDENLIDLYEQVSDYPNLWMDPPTCLRQEYASLISKNIVIV
jgi:hypothetical protein